jgi:hypothetical protein
MRYGKRTDVMPIKSEINRERDLTVNRLAGVVKIHDVREVFKNII